MLMAIAAIETRYAGCRFRSRLEARWAVFYDALGIDWEYEPQGFDLDRLVRAARERIDFALDYSDEDTLGRSAWPWLDKEDEPARPPRLGQYLPDFWLPRQQIYVEIKGEYPEQGSLTMQRLYGFSLAVMAKLVSARQFVLCCGGIPRPDHYGYGYSGSEYLSYAEIWAPWWDNYWQWNRCSRCGSLDMQFEGRAERNYCGCDAGRDYCDEDVLDAMEAARSARFEFGETPRRGAA